MTWKVDLWEYERGWGSRLCGTDSFETYEEAKEYQNEINSKNTGEKAPDWYMIARDPYYKET